jgi:glycosyltransferase involved in cell wall biosynthesis
MKILFSLTYYTPYVSGLTSYVKTLAGELALRKKYTVSVLCMKHNPSLLSNEAIDNVAIIRATPNLTISKGFLSVDWIGKSWKLINDNDVVVINLPQAEGLIPAILARILHKKLVAIYHAKVVLRGGWRDKLIERVLETINTIIMLLSHQVVTYTDVYAKTLEPYEMIKHKLAAVYPPIQVPTINQELAREIKKKIPTKAKVVLGMAARLAEDKGFENIIRAMPLLEKKWGKDKVVVVVAGSKTAVGEKHYVDKILKMVGGCQNLIFLGEVSHAAIGSFYQQIDMLILPSILESFGIVQVETMMMGKPVVASDLPGANVPINKTGMGKLVKTGDVFGLADAINDVWSKRLNYAKMQPKALREFDIKKTVEFFEKSILWDGRKQ